MQRYFTWLLALLLLVLPSQALAAAWATVERLEVLDDSGRWQVERQSAQATRTRDGATVPVTTGLALEEGDTLRTHGARLRVRYRDGGQLSIQPESELQLQEAGILQTLGQVLYQVEGVFRVRFGAVEAAVEGTRFLVSGQPAGPVTVAVDRGKVWVRAQGQQVLVHKGQVVTVPHKGLLGDVTWHSERQAASLSRMAANLGEPRYTLGLTGGTTLTKGDLQGTTSLLVRIRLLPGWRLIGSAGWATTGERFHLPVAIGAERRLGPTGVGVEALALFGQRTDCFGVATLPLQPGITATGRLRLPLTDRTALEARVRGGYAGGLYFDAAMGVSLGLGL